MLTNIEKKVKDFVAKKQLIQEGDTILVGVSGGADSMMLVDYLYTHKDKYGIKLQVAHIHHGVREEANDEKAYVIRWCEERNIPCFIHECHIQKIAKEKKISEEEAGRIERYTFFESILENKGKIAVAHHMKDQAETMLMHFFRGSDIKGLGGIQPKRGNVIRPILSLTREEIEVYCKEKHINYYNDATNFETVYTRNKMRLEYIPYIETYINPNICETLFRQGELYQEANAFLESAAEAIKEKCVRYDKEGITIDSLVLKEQMPYMQKKILYNAISELAQQSKNLSQIHIQQCLELMYLQTGKEVHLPYNIKAKRMYNTILLTQIKEDNDRAYSYTLKMGINKIEELGIEFSLKLSNTKTFEDYKENMYTKYLDYDRIKDTLQLRTRLVGDYMTLATGKKKLKKILIDDKVPQDMRQTLPLIAEGNEVIWILGSRMSSKYFVTKETKNILEIKMNKSNAQEGLC